LDGHSGDIRRSNQEINLPSSSNIESYNEIKSAEHSQLTSVGFEELKDELENAYVERNGLIQEILKTNSELDKAKKRLKIARIFIVGLIFSKFQNNVSELEGYLVDLRKQLNETVIDIDNEFDDSIHKNYNSLHDSFIKLTESCKIWDKTNYRTTNKESERTIASTSISRGLVNFKLSQIPVIKSKNIGFLIQNLNGGDLHLYPGFALMTSEMDIQKFGIIDLQEIELTYSTINFIEKEEVPIDAKSVGTTWLKVNKNGEPDKRFKGNYEIPIVRYAELNFTTKSGLNESFMISNIESAEQFYNRFLEYQKGLSS
jgi:hypothetical protein